MYTTIQEALRNFYARQAHLIDMGNHEDWADTFTPSGEFHSPTYGAAAVGRENLVNIAKQYQEGARKAGETQRHLVQDLWIEQADEQSARTRAYLMITAARGTDPGVRILRLVTIADRLLNQDGEWRVARRDVLY
ncbi:MAG TPA: nuclear transport factor 2 family protein [Castellaniella sp.]|uniref:nuclear transport factor 2 family protein n=1 Tax=Castellaniella sp. TaxID=1955812 RepID=UPI002F03F695